MDKYIKLDTAKKTLLDYIYEFDASRANPDFVRGITYAREGLDRVPLEDVAPVVHGWWERRFCHPMHHEIHKGQQYSMINLYYIPCGQP